MSGDIKFWDPIEDPKDLFAFNSDVVNFVWKTDEGEAESIFIKFVVFRLCFNCQ